MSPAPTAAALLRDLDRRQSARQMEMLADLAAREHDAVRQALRGVRGSARVDVAKLMESVRREIAERQEQRPPAQPWRWAVELMSPDQRQVFKRLVESCVDADEAAREAMTTGEQWGIPGLGTPVMSRIDGDDDLDRDDNAEDDAKKRREAVPRKKLMRTERKSKKPEREFFSGPRLLGAGDPERDKVR